MQLNLSLCLYGQFFLCSIYELFAYSKDMKKILYSYIFQDTQLIMFFWKCLIVTQSKSIFISFFFLFLGSLHVEIRSTQFQIITVSLLFYLIGVTYIHTINLEFILVYFYIYFLCIPISIYTSGNYLPSPDKEHFWCSRRPLCSHSTKFQGGLLHIKRELVQFPLSILICPKNGHSLSLNI